MKPARFGSSAANASPRNARAAAAGRSRGRARCRLQLDMIQLGDVVQIGKMGAPEQAAAETLTASEPPGLIAELRHQTQPPSSGLVGS